MFIPDKYMDYRMWSGIPDRVQGRAEVVYFDQHEQMQWTDTNSGFLDAVRRIYGDRTFDIVTAAGEAARFAFAVAEGGLAKGVVFLYPSPDRMLGELSDVDLMEALTPYLPFSPAILAAVQEGDAGQLRDALVHVVREATGPDAEARGLQLVADMYTDHAGEFLSDLQAIQLQAIQAEAVADPPPSIPPWLERPWIDRVATLTIPVTAVVNSRQVAIGEAISRSARQAEVVVAGPRLVSTAIPDPDQLATVLLRMLDRLDQCP
ncbi:MAG: hypothetical protein ACRDNW_03605 [Trebonia sp.]